MTFYTETEKIFPYLKSIRKLKNYLSFDVELPENWKLPKKYTIEGKVVEQEKSQLGIRLISFVSDFNDEELSKTIQNIKSIIDYNKELEEKEVLFFNKVEELKKIFEKQNLDKLQTLKFDIKEFNLTIEDEDQTRGNDGVVVERD
jgi:hypothetical protein